MTDENKPSSEWEHSHALNEEDEVEEVEGNGRWEVTTIEENGNVRVRRLDSGRIGPNDRDTWSENAVRVGLANGEIQRASDGKSQELSTF